MMSPENWSFNQMQYHRKQFEYYCKKECFDIAKKHLKGEEYHKERLRIKGLME